MTTLSTAPKPFVFVLMPFSRDFDDIYHLGIKEICTKCGAHCERVDEQVFEGSILERIYNQIAKADVIIADLSTKSPNVFYETGYAHALGKRVILLTQSADDIPFDMKHYTHIVYDRITDLQVSLTRHLTWYLENPEQDVTLARPTLEFFYDGHPLAEVRIAFDDSQEVIAVRVDVHNATSRSLSQVRLALITPKALPWSSWIDPRPRQFERRGVMMPDERVLHELPIIEYLLPDAWGSTKCYLARAEVSRSHGNAGETFIRYASGAFPVILRHFTELGPVDIETSIEIGQIRDI